jgi:hypothetical protein
MNLTNFLTYADPHFIFMPKFKHRYHITNLSTIKEGWKIVKVNTKGCPPEETEFFCTIAIYKTV